VKRPEEKTILVVDDDLRVLEVCCNMLAEEGYQVVPAASGEESLKLAAEFDPDLIILDIVMPGIDGYEVCERLRAHDKLSNIPIIFLSGVEKKEERSKSFDVGGDLFLKKPFSREQLVGLVKVILLTRPRA
jgi:DNA-binding response OmpR family regulator